MYLSSISAIPFILVVLLDLSVCLSTGRPALSQFDEAVFTVPLTLRGLLQAEALQMSYIRATIATKKVPTFPAHEAALIPLSFILIVVILWWIRVYIFFIIRLLLVRWFLFLATTTSSSCRFTYLSLVKLLRCFLLTIGRIVILLIIVLLEKLLIALLFACDSPIGGSYYLFLLNGLTLWSLLLHVLVHFSLLLFHLIFNLPLKELSINSLEDQYCHGKGKDVVVSHFLEHIVPPSWTETFGGPKLEELEGYDLHIFVSFTLTFLLFFLRLMRFVFIVRILYLLFIWALLVLLLHQCVLVDFAVFVPEHVWVWEALVKDHQLLAKLIDIGGGLNRITDFVSVSFKIPLSLESKTWVGVQAFDIENWLLQLRQSGSDVIGRLLLYDLFALSLASTSCYSSIFHYQLSLGWNLLSTPYRIDQRLIIVVIVEQDVSVFLSKLFFLALLSFLHLHDSIFLLFNFLFILRCRFSLL